MNTQIQKRHIAYKVWITDLVNNEFIHQSGEWDPNYVQIRDKKVSRVNIIATVVDKSKSEDGSYSYLIIDDGTDNISVKAWKEDTKLIDNIEVGTSILLIGRVREYNGNVYLTPEIVRPLDRPEWAELRKKELIKEYGMPKEITEQKEEKPKDIKEELNIAEEEISEEITTETDRQKVLNTIEKLDTEEGVPIEKITENLDLSEEKVNTLLQELIREGEIFEIAPGKIKIIE
jgi:RPA family protein